MMKKNKRILLYLAASVVSMSLASGAIYLNNEISEQQERAAQTTPQNEAAPSEPWLVAADIADLETATIVPNEDLQEYIASVFLNGGSRTEADMQALLDVVSFWEDTNDEMEIIGEIYAVRPYAEKLSVLITNRGWIESTYNEITGRTDILSAEDVKAYLAEGLSADDILAASRLSLSEEISTAQALDRVASGESWYSVATGQAAPNAEVDKLSGKEILDAAKLAKAQGTEIDTVLTGEAAELTAEGSETE